MSNIINGRQLRAARILAGLTQKQFAAESKAPTSTPSSLEKIETVLRDHGVIVFASPTPGARIVNDIAAERVIEDQS